MTEVLKKIVRGWRHPIYRLVMVLTFQDTSIRLVFYLVPLGNFPVVRRIKILVNVYNLIERKNCSNRHWQIHRRMPLDIHYKVKRRRPTVNNDVSGSVIILVWVPLHSLWRGLITSNPLENIGVNEVTDSCITTEVMIRLNVFHRATLCVCSSTWRDDRKGDS